MSMPPTSGLCPVVAAAIDRVTVDPAYRAATVDDDEITADTARELVRGLGDRLYRHLHAGLTTGTNRFPRRDVALERELTEALPVATTSVTVPVLMVDDDGAVVVERDGVRVTVAPAAVTATHPDGTVDIAVSTARPALSPGFFLTTQEHSGEKKAVLRVYLHLRDIPGLLFAWRRVLGWLHQAKADYRAKVISRPEYLPRRDALVVYLDAGSADLATWLPRVLDGCPGLGEQTSAFAARVHPGVAVAWEPADTRVGMRELSFGQHRAMAMATGLVRQATAPRAASGAESVARAFVEANIDPLRPWRNLDSPDLPGLCATHIEKRSTDEHV
ncbi:T3SS effector HopA1 family protein [Actinophytocola sp.]|uniref:T3SS effector HopA1 family protein n=1 Tax=Actinophytocola sp. TaxID=1872138 RepID=UPI00389AA435